MALKSNVITSRQISDTVSNLNFISHRNNITLRWVKAHVNHTGNERADELAKLGVDSPDRMVPDLPKVSNKAVRTALRLKVVEYWNADWQQEQPCRQTKHYFPAIDRKQAVLFTDCTRKVFTAATHIVTGHNLLNRHQYLVNRGTDHEVYPFCRYCDEDEETSFHLVAECPAFARLRREIFGHHTLTIPFTFKPVKLFKFIELAKWANCNTLPDPPSQLDRAQQSQSDTPTSQSQH